MAATFVPPSFGIRYFDFDELVHLEESTRTGAYSEYVRLPLNYCGQRRPWVCVHDFASAHGMSMWMMLTKQDTQERQPLDSRHFSGSTYDCDSFINDGDSFIVLHAATVKRISTAPLWDKDRPARLNAHGKTMVFGYIRDRNPEKRDFLSTLPAFIQSEIVRELAELAAAAARHRADQKRFAEQGPRSAVVRPRHDASRRSAASPPPEGMVERCADSFE